MVIQQFRADGWEDLKEFEVQLKTTISAFCQSVIIKSQLSSHLLDTASYKNRVARHCLFLKLRYDKLLSKNSVKIEGKYQLEDDKYKIMKKVSEPGEYEMGWWRMFKDVDEVRHRFRHLDVVPEL